jgi:hypothetical protein
MKARIFALLAAVFIVASSAPSFAAPPAPKPPALPEVEWDVSSVSASGPAVYNADFGVNFGAGYILSSIDTNFQVRFDLSFYQFTHDFPAGRGIYTRMPLTISARYYLPIRNKLKGFVQTGLEASFDNYPDTAELQLKNDLNLGVSPGAGIEYFVKRNVSLFALGRAHIVADGYFSIHAGAAAHY